MENDDLPDFIFSQEAMRQQDAMYPSYEFGSEPQLENGQSQRLPDVTQRNDGEASGSGRNGQPSASAGGIGMGTRTQRARHGKIFSDPIHGTFRLDPANVDVIDTPQFQRLRDLHQLGLTHLVFPGAVHTRFEHSLGTSFKAWEVADRIWRTQRRELDMERDDVRLVSLAGLCHDLGHGPFSHVFEHEFLRRKLDGEMPGTEDYTRLREWHHETMSTRILEYLVDDNNIEGISQEDIRRISNFIRGDAHEDQGYLFDIVNNKRCGVDVDKIDYLQRDAKMCDVNIGCDFKRMLMLSKVVQNQIAYKWSEYSNIWDLFHARESMHRKVYTHRKTKAVEFMVVDALLEADLALGFSENIYRAEDFCTLDDSLLKHIQHYGKVDRRRRGPELDNGADGPLARAQQIITRLFKRDLYRYGNQFTVPFEHLQNGGRWEALSKEFTAANVALCYHGSEVRLRPDDVIVSQTKIDFTQGLGNPLNNVLFFDHNEDEVGRRIEPHQVVGILPQYHQERILRVYTPRSDPAYQRAVGDALANWCKRHFGSNAQMATPARPRQTQGWRGRETALREADPRRAFALPRVAPGSATVTTAATTATLGTACRGASVTANGGGGGAAAAAAPVDPRFSNGSAAAGSTRGAAAGAAAAAAGSAAGPSRGGAGGAPGALSQSHHHHHQIHQQHQHQQPQDADPMDHNSDGGGGNDDGGAGGGGGGTPTRSTPLGLNSVLSTAADGSQLGGRGPSEGSVMTGGRAKRPRSSGALFQDA